MTECGVPVPDTAEAEQLISYGEGCLNAAVHRSQLPAAPPSPVLGVPLGLFATLRVKGKLRGCIGQFAGRAPLEEIFCQVVSDAALADYRFSPVTPDELDGVSLELSLLGQSYEKPDPQEFLLGSEGVVLRARGRRSVFLPEVSAEQGWDLVTTLSRLAQKAGLERDAWQDADARFEAFRSVKIKRAAPGGPVEVRLL